MFWKKKKTNKTESSNCPECFDEQSQWPAEITTMELQQQKQKKEYITC